ncbi:hypothetical protein THIOKS1860004 [Thiocapsa sp. KS1]|nr:hypothetical protein THIOKS1860004 [Thiocapsa sp. KS1]
MPSRLVDRLRGRPIDPTRKLLNEVAEWLCPALGQPSGMGDTMSGLLADLPGAVAAIALLVADLARPAAFVAVAPLRLPAVGRGYFKRIRHLDLSCVSRLRLPWGARSGVSSAWLRPCLACDFNARGRANFKRSLARLPVPYPLVSARLSADKPRAYVHCVALGQAVISSSGTASRRCAHGRRLRPREL